MLWALLLACSGPKDGPPGDGADTGADTGAETSADTGEEGYLLAVSGGWGGGRYRAGEEVHVWSGVFPYDGWVEAWSPAEGLGDPGEWNSVLVMPPHDLSLVTTVRDAAAPMEELVVPTAGEDRAAAFVAPAKARGLVLFFHGARYSHSEIGDNAALTVVGRLVAAGWAVLALDSAAATRSGTGGWDDVVDDDNADLAAVREAVAWARAAGKAPAEGPVVAWGMSSGGQFAHAVGLSLPAEAVLASCAPGRSSTLAETAAPTAWFLAEADGTFPTGAEDAAAAAEGLAARGVLAEVNVHPRTPLYAQRFTRVPGVDAERSAAIAADIRGAGYFLDEGGWQVPGATVTGAMDWASLDGLDDTQRAAVAAEIEIMAADHELYDDYAGRMVDFLSEVAGTE